ncbi:MAG: HlyD family efflux transporter periplasmic adaptor subunit [Aliiglaciecola sp.]|uniref:HlyD family secretion protein n=1 Tax=Aliiglaciecola sp. TaxID=1872441 RepID=UPI00329A0C1D
MKNPSLIWCVIWLSVYSLLGCSEAIIAADDSEEINEGIIAPAELVSLQDAPVGPPSIRRMWQFKIEYLAPENALITKGEIVVKFDGDKLTEDLVSKQSDLEAAIKESEKRKLKEQATQKDLELNMAEAKMNMEISQRKVAITDASRSEVERLKQVSEYEINRVLYQQSIQKLAQHKERMVINGEVQNGRIKKLQLRVKNIQDSLDKLIVKAPKNGLVVYQVDNNDNKPAVGETVYMGRPIVTLPSLDKLAVKVEFDESDSSIVKVGQQVKVILDAHPEKPFAGTITSLGQAYRNRSQHNLKVVFDAWVKLEKLDLDMMRPGMKANVQLLIKERT